MFAYVLRSFSVRSIYCDYDRFGLYFRSKSGVWFFGMVCIYSFLVVFCCLFVCVFVFRGG